jgi:hypothetical protein
MKAASLFVAGLAVAVMSIAPANRTPECRWRLRRWLPIQL